MPTVTVNGRRVDFELTLTQGNALYGQVGLDASVQLLVWDRRGRIDVPLSMDDWFVPTTDMSLYTVSPTEVGRDLNPQVRTPSNVMLDGVALVPEQARHAKYTGKEIKEMSHLMPEDNELFATIPDSRDRKVEDAMRIVLTDDLSLYSNPLIEDLENCACHDRYPRQAGRYRIKIDREVKEVGRRMMTGNELLGLVSKKSDEWLLNKKYSTFERRVVEPDEVVDFLAPGVERFETIPSMAKQGGVREGKFALPEDDVEYLSRHFPGKWEIKTDPMVLILHGFKIPAGYDHEVGSLLLKFPPSYPLMQFDMFYLEPKLHKKFREEPAGTTLIRVHDNLWQQWSRHYGKLNVHNNIAKHLAFVRHVLAREASC